VTTTKLLIVDDDEDLRQLLKEFFEMSMTVECVTAGSLRDLEKVKASALECTVAVLDINLGANEPSGIDVFNWLREAGFKGRVAFVTAHANDHPLVRKAVSDGGAKVYKKPMEIEALIELVKGE
jgi:DNA-binding NtrC family response regulator